MGLLSSLVEAAQNELRETQWKKIERLIQENKLDLEAEGYLKEVIYGKD